MLLTSRRLLQSKALDIENDLRGTLRNFGLKLGLLGAVKFEDRVRELLADYPDVAAIIEPLLIARRVLREQLGVLHRQLLENVRRECSIIPVLCTTGMPRTAVALAGVPAVGPVAAPTVTGRACADLARAAVTWVTNSFADRAILALLGAVLLVCPKVGVLGWKDAGVSHGL